MGHKVVIDTHALIWFVEGNKRLSEPAKTILSASDSQLVLPIIVLAEASLIIEKGRTTIKDAETFFDRIYADPRIEIIPFTIDIFKKTLTPAAQEIPELHDRFIVSTGLHLKESGYTVEIVTNDLTITAANVLSVIW